MKKKIIIIVCCITLILSDYVNYGQSSNQTEGKQKRTIALDEFKLVQKETSDYYTELLGRQIPFMISFSLRDFGYQIKWTEQMMEQRSLEVQLQYRQNEEETIHEILSVSGVNYLVSGSFFLRDETNMDIEIILKRVMEGGQLEILNYYGLPIYSLDDLYYELKSLGSKIHADITESLMASVTKTMAFVKFSTHAFENQEIDPLFPEDVTYSLYYDLKDFTKIKIMDWEMAEKKLAGHDPQDIHESSTMLEADVYVDGVIDYFNSDGDYRILPRLYINSEKCTINIPGPLKRSSDYFEVQSTYSYLINLLDELIADNGTFNKGLIKILKDKDVPNLEEWANNYYSNREYEMAAILINSVLQDDQDNQDARLLLAKCKTELFEYDEAFELCGIIELNNPGNTFVPFQKGMIYKYKQEYDSAVIEFNKVKELDENFENINYQIGLVHYFNSDYPEAINSFNEQASQNPGDIELRMMLALSYLESGIEALDYHDKHEAFNNAYEAAKLANQLCKSNLKCTSTAEIENIIYSILGEHGSTAFYDKKFLEAVELFREMKKIKLNVYILDMLRLCYSNLEDFNELESVISEGMDSRFYSDTIYFQQAQYLRSIKDSIGNYSRAKLTYAMHFLDEYLKINENQSIALRVKGSTYFRMDSLDKAIELYEQAYDYEKNEQAKASIILNIAELSIMNGHYHKSLENLNKLEITEWSVFDRTANSNRCLDLYLTIVTKYLLDQDIQEETTTLNKFIDENTLTGWSFTTFKNWLNADNNELTRNQRSFILDLTIKMERRTKSY